VEVWKEKPPSNVGSSTTRIMDRTAAFQLSLMHTSSCAFLRYTPESLKNVARVSISYHFASVIVHLYPTIARRDPRTQGLLLYSNATLVPTSHGWWWKAALRRGLERPQQG
jgi:hypothetical protein